MAHHVGERALSGLRPAARPLQRALVVMAGAALLGCSSSSGSSRACGFETPTSAVRFHSTIARNAQWPQQVTLLVDEAPGDSTVRVLFVHASAVQQADRDFVIAHGATITQEPTEWNGIVASMTVSGLRSLAPEANTMRIWDAHLLRDETILPPCE